MYKNTRMVAAVEGTTTKEDNPLNPPDTTTKITKLIKGKTTFTASTSMHSSLYSGCVSNPHLMDFAVKSTSINAYIVKLYNDTS